MSVLCMLYSYIIFMIYWFERGLHSSVTLSLLSSELSCKISSHLIIITRKYVMSRAVTFLNIFQYVVDGRACNLMRYLQLSSGLNEENNDILRSFRFVGHLYSRDLTVPSLKMSQNLRLAFQLTQKLLPPRNKSINTHTHCLYCKSKYILCFFCMKGDWKMQSNLQHLSCKQ